RRARTRRGASPGSASARGRAPPGRRRPARPPSRGPARPPRAPPTPPARPRPPEPPPPRAPPRSGEGEPEADDPEVEREDVGEPRLVVPRPVPPLAEVPGVAEGEGDDQLQQPRQSEMKAAGPHARGAEGS